ncbi:MAG: hypothetical protein GF418_05845 [Chitinivibrionales bacterium]|nr:hypothetical protein [Chitinivibrionales bacterium]MBD3395133.1 hypothetical protein [Chitinivibrionales bacterium]
MRRQLTALGALALTMAVMVLVVCDLGKEPLAPSVPGATEQPTVDPSTGDTISADSVTPNMRIFVQPSNIRATNNDGAEVAVLLFDDDHNPVSDTIVYFSATHGIVTAKDTTDAEGIARAVFRSVPVNTEAWIYARATLRLANGDTTITVGYPVTIYGLTVTAWPSVTDAVNTSSIPVQIEVLDAAGDPVSNTRVILSGAIRDTIVTRGDGTFDTVLVAKDTTADVDTSTLVVSALGTADTIAVRFWEDLPTGMSGNVSVRPLRVFSSRSQLKADNSDHATITAILIDGNNNPLVGNTISFKSDFGIIDASATVDSTGRASVKLRSAPVDTICTVWAIADLQDDTASTQIAFRGIGLLLTADPLNLRTGDSSTVEAVLTDASGNAIGGDRITFQVKNGQFAGGLTSLTTTLNPEGKATVKVSSASSGTAEIVASANNAHDSVSIVFTTNTLSLSAGKVSIDADGLATTKLTATYRNGAGQVQEGVPITFATNAGTVSPSVDTTNSKGKATTTLRSADFATFAIVQANAPNGTAVDTVYFTATRAADIMLEITPDNISTNGGRATLIATVTDSTGNRVTGASVNFKIVKGPGGDEHIEKPVVISQDGTARSTLIGGAVPSAYRGCEVAVYVQDTIADTSKLTISGEPYVITVSRPEDDTVTVPNAGIMDESTFEFHIGAVVQDINGNPVADNTEVHFSAVVTGQAVGMNQFVRWSGEGSLDEIKPIIKLVFLDVPFEDINNNYQMDPSIDLRLDDWPNYARRGDDFDGDGTVDYSYSTHDFFWDFNLNGVCDTGGTLASRAEPVYEASKKYYLTLLGYDTTYSRPYVDTIITPSIVGGVPTFDTTYEVVRDTFVTPLIDTTGYTYELWADLNGNGVWDTTEWVDTDNDGTNDLPEAAFNSRWAYDFNYWRWEMRANYMGYMPFFENDYAVVIDASAPTEEGVAYARLTYPRQMALRLRVTVNAEANGIRDKDGERFVLPIIREGG